MLGFLIFRLIEIDDSAHHSRLWAEIRVLATLTQRRDLRAAHSLHTHALAAANAISDVNIMKSLTTGELGYVAYRMKKYDQSIERFDEAIEMNQKLLSMKDPHCDPRLIKAELVKLALFKARAFAAKGNKKESLKACSLALEFGARRFAVPPVDLAVCDRFGEAFTRGCELSVNYSELQVLTATLTPQVVACLPAGCKNDVRHALKQALETADVQPQDKERMLKVFELVLQ